MQTAKILKEDKVLTAKAHYAKKKGKPFPESPYDWRDSTIVGILERMDYCGHTMNFKSYSKSHKLKKRIPTTKERQAIFYNTHEAIVEDTVFERVQELRANKRRPTKAAINLPPLFICGIYHQLLFPKVEVHYIIRKFKCH